MNWNSTSEKALSDAKNKPHHWGLKQRVGRFIHRLMRKRNRLIPDDAIRHMYHIQGHVCRIRCVSVRGEHACTGIFTCNLEQNKLHCEQLLRETEHANKYHREWSVYDGTSNRILSPEEDCNEEIEQLRFSSVESEGFCLLRAMVVLGDVSIAPGVSSDLDKVYYSLDKRGRYVVSSEAAPLAELFAMSALFMAEERGHIQTNSRNQLDIDHLSQEGQEVHNEEREPKCDVCGGTEGLLLCCDFIEIHNEDGTRIYSEPHGTPHCLCPKHMDERKTISQKYITATQLGRLLICTGMEEKKVSRQKRMWLEQVIQNFLRGLRQI